MPASSQIIYTPHGIDSGCCLAVVRQRQAEEQRQCSFSVCSLTLPFLLCCLRIIWMRSWGKYLYLLSLPDTIYSYACISLLKTFMEASQEHKSFCGITMSLSYRSINWSFLSPNSNPGLVGRKALQNSLYTRFIQTTNWPKAVIDHHRMFSCSIANKSLPL